MASTRQAFGARLAVEQPAAADVVVPVPDSGMYAALGYARQSGIPFGLGLVRNHYVGRTFIEPKQSIRHFGVKVKLNPVREVVDGKRIVLVDDSIVRGTTSRKIVRHASGGGGARGPCPRVVLSHRRRSCHYGIDTPTRRELIAANQSVEEIRSSSAPIRLGLPLRGRDAGGLRPSGAVHVHGVLHGRLSGRDLPRNSEKEAAVSG